MQRRRRVASRAGSARTPASSCCLARSRIASSGSSPATASKASCPTASVGQIQDQEMVPAFRAGRLATGVERGVRALARRIAADKGVTLTGVPAAARPRRAPSRRVDWLTLVILVALHLPRGRHAASRGSRGARRRGGFIPGGYWGGGGFGGGGFGGGGGGFGGSVAAASAAAARGGAGRADGRRRHAERRSDGSCCSSAAARVAGCGYNRLVGAAREHRRGVGAGREPAPAPERPDPEPRRGDEGLRARTRRRSSRRSPNARSRLHRRRHARREDRRRERARTARSAGCSRSPSAIPT